MGLDGGALAGILIKPTVPLLEVSSTSTEGFHCLKQQTKCVKRDLKDGLSYKRFLSLILEIRSEIYHRSQILRLFVLFVCICYNGCVALLMKKRKRRLLLVLVRLYASHL